jgi:hypothetical protein
MVTCCVRSAFRLDEDQGTKHCFFRCTGNNIRQRPSGFVKGEARIFTASIVDDERFNFSGKKLKEPAQPWQNDVLWGTRNWLGADKAEPAWPNQPITGLRRERTGEPTCYARTEADIA